MNDSKRIRILSITLLLCIAAPFSANAQSTFQASNAHVFMTDIAVAGAGTLLREADGVKLRVEMDGLDSNSAYTLWWIIFNNPGACTDGTAPALCGLGDVGFEPADTAVRNAAAFISSPSGTGNTTGEMDVGPAPAGAAGFGQLNDSVGAEIHIIVQTHGRPLVGSVAAQMTIPGAACNKICEDQFALVFLPVGP
jgi:hypothetical protein